MSQWQYRYPSAGLNSSNVEDEQDFTDLLEDASKAELEELMENEDKINEIVLDHEKVYF